MHDDQHGTAVIAGAALINALIVQQKEIRDIRLVVNGAGAAATACTRLMIALGVDREKIVMCDSKGVIYKGRAGVNESKAEFAIEPDGRITLADAVRGAYSRNACHNGGKADRICPCQSQARDSPRHGSCGKD